MSVDTESRRLAERILDSVPLQHLAFTKLIGLLEIRADRTVRTACVTMGARSRLLINPDFVREKCPTDRMLATLVLHELYHVLLGHTRIYGRATLAKNLVFDAVINAHLSRAQPDPEGTALFRSQYAPDRFPEALLRPPEGWPDAPRWRLTGAALEAHQALYADVSATYAELFELLERATVTIELDFDAGRLLGEHDGPDDPASGAGPGVLDAVRRLVASWPALTASSGRDMGLGLERNRLTPEQARHVAVERIRAALAAAGGVTAGFGGVATPSSADVPGLLPYRTRVDRRSEVRAAAGGDPLLFRSTVRTPALDRRDRVHLYLDVSGSMICELPLVYGALQPLNHLLHDPAHLFSTDVADVALDDLRRGVVKTTSGTSVHCVTAHMIAHDVRRAAILTDGWVGEVPEEHRRTLRRRRARLCAVVTDGGAVEFAEQLGARVFRLPSLDRTGGSR